MAALNPLRSFVVGALNPKTRLLLPAGQLVEPKKHIVYYVDPAFPPVWRKAINVGVLRWNAAFEKIGFKDVVQVRDYPTDDPEFDPDNLEYTCIRFVPSGVETPWDLHGATHVGRNHQRFYLHLSRCQ